MASKVFQRKGSIVIVNYLMFILNLVCGENVTNQDDNRTCITVANAIEIIDKPEGIKVLMVFLCKAAQQGILDANDANTIPGYKLELDSCVYQQKDKPKGYETEKRTYMYHYTLNTTSRHYVPLIWYGGYWGLSSSIPVTEEWPFVTMTTSDSTFYRSDKIVLYFSRIIGNNTICADAYTQLIIKYGWKKVGFIMHNDERMRVLADRSYEQLTERNITVKRTIDYDYQRSSPESVRRSWLDVIDSDIRIIFVWVPTFALQHAVCLIHKMGLFGHKYAIFHGYVSNVGEKYWRNEAKNTNCTADELFEVLYGSITCSQSPDFVKDYKHEYTREDSDTVFARANMAPEKDNAWYNLYRVTYDGSWAMALALNKSKQDLYPNKLESFYYGNKEYVETLYRNLMSIHFHGISGQFSFDPSTGERRSEAMFTLYDEKGHGDDIGNYSQRTFKLEMTRDETFIWKSKGGNVPKDEDLIKVTVTRIHPTVLIVLPAIGLCGILIGLGYLLFMCINHDHIAIHGNWPVMCCVIACGCIILQSFVALHLGFVFINTSSWKDAICIVEVVLLVFGFIILVGGIEVKLWGMHAFFNWGKVKIKEGWLLLLIIGMLCIDIIVLVLWLRDPFFSDLTEVSQLRDNTTSVVNLEYVAVCTSPTIKYYTIGILCYKGVILILGITIALPALLVSKKKGFVEYMVAALFLIVASCIGMLIVFLMITDDPNLHFIITSVLILFVTIFTQL